MIAQQISFRISAMGEASPDSPPHASRIEFTVGIGCHAPQALQQLEQLSGRKG